MGTSRLARSALLLRGSGRPGLGQAPCWGRMVTPLPQPEVPPSFPSWPVSEQTWQVNYGAFGMSCPGGLRGRALGDRGIPCSGLQTPAGFAGRSSVEWVPVKAAHVVRGKTGTLSPLLNWASGEPAAFKSRDEFLHVRQRDSVCNRHSEGSMRRPLGHQNCQFMLTTREFFSVVCFQSPCTANANLNIQ